MKKQLVVPVMLPRGGEEGDTLNIHAHSSQNVLGICSKNTEIQTPEALILGGGGSTSGFHPFSLTIC